MNKPRKTRPGKAPDAAPAKHEPGASTSFDATVLQVVPNLMTGGVERGTVDIAQAIAAAGGRAIVASAGGRLERDLERAGAEHVTLPLDRKNPLAVHGNVARLASLIRAEKVDIVHARSRAPAWSARAAARRTGRPLVTTFHGVYNAGNFLKRCYNSIMTKGDRVIAISDFIAEHIDAHYRVDPARVTVIHRGVDLEVFDPRNVPPPRLIQLAEKWRLPDGAPVIMLPGRLTRWKGQAVFLEAIKLLGRDDIGAVLLGSDQGRVAYRSELEELVRKRGLEKIVRFVDDARDMPAALMLADVVVSASTDPEAFGRVITEAQAMGRPVVATNHGGARETVIEGRTGWLVPPRDPDALAAAMAEALSLDAPARQRLARDAISHVRSHFSKQVMGERTLAVYAELLRQARR